MNPLKISLLSLYSISIAVSSVTLAQDSPKNLVTNGNFEIADSSGFPQDWTCSHPNYLKQCETTIELLAEGDLTFVRISKLAVSEPGVGWQDIQIPPGAGSLRIAAKMRGNSIVRGSESWHLPGIGVTYFIGSDDNPKPGAVDKWLRIPIGDSDWADHESIIPIREGATKARISLIGQGWTGTADITNVVVEAIE